LRGNFIKIDQFGVDRLIVDGISPQSPMYDTDNILNQMKNQTVGFGGNVLFLTVDVNLLVKGRFAAVISAPSSTGFGGAPLDRRCVITLFAADCMSDAGSLGRQRAGIRFNPRAPARCPRR
jgi:hypothetical protein